MALSQSHMESQLHSEGEQCLDSGEATICQGLVLLQSMPPSVQDSLRAIKDPCHFPHKNKPSRKQWKPSIAKAHGAVPNIYDWEKKHPVYETFLLWDFVWGLQEIVISAISIISFSSYFL